ncbi:MAG: dihydrofolate reductase family protein [Thermotogota bacterium]
MFIKMLMVQSLNGVVNQNGFKKWNSEEDFIFLQKQIELSDSIIISRETFNLNKKFYNTKKCIVLNTEKEEIINNVIYTKYTRAKIKKIIKTYNFENTLLLGGPTINSFLLNDGLIDEICITIEPVIFSGDKTLFDNYIINKKFEFKMKNISKLNDNTLLLNYSILK